MAGCMAIKIKDFILSGLGNSNFSFVKDLWSSLIVRRFADIFSVDILVRASAFIFLPIYLSLMTKDEFGLYGYLISIISSFSLILGFGLYVPQIKMYHDYDDEMKRGEALFTLNFSLLILLSIVICVVYLYELDFIAVRLLFKNNIKYADYRIYVLSTVIVSVFGLMLYSFFLASENIRIVKLYNILKFFAGNIIVIAALYFIAHKDSVLIRIEYSLLAEACLLCVFGYLFVKKMVPSLRLDILTRSLKIGIPVMLSALLNMFYNLSDRFFLEKYHNFEALAVYNLGLAFSSIIPIIMTSFQAIYAPIFFKEKDARLNLRRVNRVAILAIIAFLLISAGIIVMTKIMILNGIIRKGYNQVTLLLPILLIASITMALSQLYQNFMVYFEVTHIMLVFFMFTNIICVIFSMLLIPRFGIYGAASAVAISGSFSLIMHYIFVVKRDQRSDAHSL